MLWTSSLGSQGSHLLLFPVLPGWEDAQPHGARLDPWVESWESSPKSCRAGWGSWRKPGKQDKNFWFYKKKILGLAGADPASPDQLLTSDDPLGPPRPWLSLARPRSQLPPRWAAWTLQRGSSWRFGPQEAFSTSRCYDGGSISPHFLMAVSQR